MIVLLDITKFLINALYVTSPDIPRRFVVVSAAMSSAVMSSMMRKIIREFALDKTTLQFKLPSCKNRPLAASGIITIQIVFSKKAFEILDNGRLPFLHS